MSCKGYSCHINIKSVKYFMGNLIIELTWHQVTILVFPADKIQELLFDVKVFLLRSHHHR